MHGTGTFSNPDKQYSYTGDYCHDLKHGAGIENELQETYEGHFNKGTRCG